MQIAGRETVAAVETVIDLISTLVRNPKNGAVKLFEDFKGFIDDVFKWLEELFGVVRKDRVNFNELGGDLRKSFFENAGIRIENVISNAILHGQTKDYTCVATSLRMALEDKGIIKSEEYLATALKTDKNGASILDIPESLYNSRLDEIVVIAEKDIRLPELVSKLQDGDKAVVSISTEEFGSHAVLIDKIENGKVIIRDPLPKDVGSSYSISIENFKQVFNRRAVIIKK